MLFRSILDTQADIRDREGAGRLPALKGEVEFSHVSFAYSDEPDKLILKDVSFTAKPGETIALVGPTGAGKTTIVNLISRFYEAEEGKVLLDGMEVKEVALESLRSQAVHRAEAAFGLCPDDDCKAGDPDPGRSHFQH